VSEAVRTPERRARPSDLRDPRLDRDGYVVLRRVVPQDAVEKALRCLHLDILRRGLSAAEIAGYQEAKCWFPHLRWEEPILGLLEHVPPMLRHGTQCDPQILLHFPDEASSWPIEPHVDEPPPWADGRPYRTILGVALSHGYEANGGLIVWPLRGGGATAVELASGDVVAMHPNLGHTGGLNRDGAIRYTVYFRFLES
jgi:hypothetical protein